MKEITGAACEMFPPEKPISLIAVGMRFRA